MTRNKKYPVYMFNGYEIFKVADFYAQGDALHYCRLRNKDLKANKDSKILFSVKLDYLKLLQEQAK